MKRVLLFQSYQEKLKTFRTQHFQCSSSWAWAGGEGVGLAKYFMYDGQCENGESVFTLNKGEFALFISLS